MPEELELEERVGLLPADASALPKVSSDENINGIHEASPSWPTGSRKSPWRSRARTGIEFIWVCILFLLPSFISRVFSKKNAPEITRLRPTAWLDGLRGLAAWAVFNQHLATSIYKENYVPWGQGGTRYEIYRFPGIWLLYSGPFAVGLFFVISGYVLSITPIHQMQQPSFDSEAAVRKTGSAIFRRPIRLIIPTWVSNLLVFFLVRSGYLAGLQMRLPRLLEVIHGQPQLTHMTPRYLLTAWAQFVDLMRTNMATLWIFTDYLVANKVTVYNSVTWTIPLELRSSLMLYATHIMLYFIRPRWRFGIVLFLIFVGVIAQGYDLPLFWAGFLIAKSCEAHDATVRNRKILISAPWWLLLFSSFFIGSFPEWDADTSGVYSWMIPLSPFSYQPGFRFYTGLASVFAALAISKLPILTRFLSISPIQYLGRVSFGLYLVQVWIINGVGMVIFYNVWSFTGKETLLAHLFGFLVAYIGVLGISIWVADIFWRAVDRPSVSLGFKLERWLYLHT